ncbi:MAG: tetratricopeptide repeat protein [Candidatus Zixiibacteriota bacterium]|nr:MAG: tetratricopeptide repeat protein [candidate division Zixibacteria bacterium]
MNKITKPARLISGITLLFISGSCGLFAPGEDAYLKNYTKGHEYMLQNQPARAIPFYKKALKQNEHFTPVYQELAVCYQQVGEDDSAIVYYMGAIAHNPRNVDAYQSIGNIHFMQGQYDDALIWYERASEVDELYPRTYNNMATIWLFRDNLKIAKKYYEQAITVDATYPRAYYGLGLVALEEKNIEEAESRFIDAFKVGEMPEAIYMLGQLYYDTEQKEKSLVWFRKYLEKESTGQWAEKARDMIFLLEQELPIDK